MTETIKTRSRGTFVQWIVFAIVFAVLVYGFQIMGLINIPSFDTSNSENSNVDTAVQAPDGSTDNIVPVKDTVSGKPVAPSGNTNTQKAFYKIDSAECKDYKEKVYVGIYSMIVGSGSVGGPVGSSFWVRSNPMYGTDSSLAKGISCPSWTASKSLQGNTSNYNVVCRREPGQPFTTTWTIIDEGPVYGKSIGRERTIHLEGVLDDGEGTGMIVNNPFAFQCITNGGY